MKNLKIKQLAEEFLFCDKKLTQAERKLLESSMYAPLLGKRINVFDVAANLIIENNEPAVPTPSLQRQDVSKVFTHNLIREIEDEFGLDLARNTFPNYDAIPLKEFKEFITSYLSRYRVNSYIVKKYEEILKKNDVAAIFTAILNEQRVAQLRYKN